MRRSSIWPIAAGVCVTVFWTLAFAVGLAVFAFGNHPETQWWNIGFLRHPGEWLGHKVFSGYEKYGRVDYGHIIEKRMNVFIALLAATATAIGIGVWLVTQLGVFIY